MPKNKNFISRFRLPEFFQSNPVALVLILSGALGFALGLHNATWQQSVETGQVVANIVEYPQGSFNYVLNLKLLSVASQLSGFALFVTDSEILTSFLVSGAVLMLAFQALSVLIFAINRHILFSVLGTVLIYLTSYIGFGVIYNISLLDWNTFGVIGLSATVLLLGLVGAQSYKLAACWGGVIFCIHPTQAAWSYLLLTLASLCQWRFAKKFVKNYYPYFLAGLAMTACSFLFQFYLLRDVPNITSAQEKVYLVNFIKYWSYHHRKFYWNYQTSSFQFIRADIVYCLFSIWAALLGLRFFKGRDALMFMMRVIVISGILALVLGVTTHVPPEIFPKYFLLFMAGRHINLNNIILGAFLLGFVTCRESRASRMNFLVFFGVLLIALAPEGVFRLFHLAPRRQLFSYVLMLLWFSYLVFNASSLMRRIKTMLSSKIAAMKTRFLVARPANAMYMALFIVCILELALLGRASHSEEFTFFCDRTNNAFYAKIAQGKGMLLVTDAIKLISLKTRRPMLIDAWDFDMFTLGTEYGDVVNAMLQKVYGLDLLVPLPETLPYPRGANIPSSLYKRLWESRTLQEWQAIRKEFGVTSVITQSDWNLLLPIVAKHGQEIAYHIPEETIE